MADVLLLHCLTFTFDIFLPLIRHPVHNTGNLPVNMGLTHTTVKLLFMALIPSAA